MEGIKFEDSPNPEEIFGIHTAKTCKEYAKTAFRNLKRNYKDWVDLPWSHGFSELIDVIYLTKKGFPKSSRKYF
jgi:hypothetical protein